MSYLGPLFEGDFNIGPSTDHDQFGYGDLSVHRNVIIHGDINSTGSPSEGSLLLSGGALINKNVHIKGQLNVLYDTTNLTETHINTDNGATTITGGNGLHVSVGDESYIISTGGHLTMESNSKKLNLFAGYNGAGAIDIHSKHIQGGIRLLTETNGKVDIITGNGGIIGVTSSGNIAMTANNESASFNVNSSTGNQNLSISLNGLTDSSLVIESSGINTTKRAMSILTTNTHGKMRISNVNGSGSGNIEILTGSGGYYVITNTGGNISQLSQGAGSSYNVSSNGVNQNLDIILAGETASGIYIKSEGITDAINIETTNTAGNIVIRNKTGSVGGVSIYSGISGFLCSATGGPISITSYGGVSNYKNVTNANDQDLHISVEGDTKSKLKLSSTGKNSDAILLETTTNTGGILINSRGEIGIQSETAINIGTSNENVPITLGTNTSVTTILGDLYVRGNTSSVDLQVVKVDDNILTFNNAPYGISDGGFAIKRYQPANDTAQGVVVTDTAVVTGNIRNIENTSTTTTLATNASSVDDYYKGWWIKITGGQGVGQVRKVKSYNSYDKILTIYSSYDQVNELGNPQPVEGLDFNTTLDSSSQYALYPCHYVMNIWDESAKEFAFICSSTNPADSQPVISHYSNLHINNLTSNAITTAYINNSPADITTTVTLGDNGTVPVEITDLPEKYGMYMVFVKPATNNLRTHAIFTIGRLNDQNYTGQSNRIFSIKGTQGEQVGIQWRANEKPELMYRTPPRVDGSTDYKLRITSL